MRKFIITALLFIMAYPCFAMIPLDSDSSIQAAIDEGKAAKSMSRGYMCDKRIARIYKITTHLFTPYMLIRNNAQQAKILMKDYTVQDAKSEVIDKHLIEVDFTIAAQYNDTFGKTPKSNVTELCSYLIYQGNTTIRPLTADEKTPQVSTGYWKNTYLIYEVKTTWDFSTIDPSRPITIRVVLDNKYADYTYDLNEYK